MLLTIATTRRPATDLGFLLHKNPANVNTVELSFGCARVFYPEASEERCTAALLVEVDPIGLVRGRGPAGEGFSLQQYVNDRPYVASSLMSVALSRVFGTAMSGRSKERPELVGLPIPLEVRIAVLPVRGAGELVRELFEPLGYFVELEKPTIAGHGIETDWDANPYWTATLRAETALRALLEHLYVLIPVLDNDKHYWIGDDEVDKLIKHGKGWLAEHPLREQIAQRYLKRQRRLVNDALERLIGQDAEAESEAAEFREQEELAVEKPIRLNDQRMEAVMRELTKSEAKSVLDLGCGEGKLLRRLLKEKQFKRIVGMDVAFASLERAKDRLHWERMPPAQKERLELLHGSLMYRDRRLEGFEAAAAVEVIEHLDPPRLATFERVLFECARPDFVVITTPNVEYNVRFPTLPAGAMRHRDHRFEWTRAEFEAWARGAAERNGYQVRFEPIGTLDETVGAPTQMGVFRKE